ncbi:MAG: hypothetical protein SCK70_08760 [bacterium]|nr:hypothetical protein [bacterium]
MAGTDFRFQRHLKLWEEQNKLIKRTIIATCIFSIVLLIRVLTPLTRLTTDTEQVETQLMSLQEDKSGVENLSNQLAEVNEVLAAVQQNIEVRPWEHEKKELIKSFSRMRNRDDHSLSRQEYQDTANTTIRKITKKVDEVVVSPLERSMASNPLVRQELRQVEDRLEILKGHLKEWRQQNLGKDWYVTLAGKDRTMDELTETLNGDIQQFSKVLSQEQSNISEIIETQERKAEELQIDIEDKQQWLDQLNSDMQKILPGWLQNLLGVDEMIQIFPMVLLALALYVFLLALSLARHYGYVARKVNLTAEDRRDLAASSLWTLTDRGRTGNLITIAVFMMFFTAMWLFYEWGFLLFHRWLITTDQVMWYTRVLGSKAIIWVGRLIFLMVVGTIVVRPKWLKLHTDS